MQRLEVSGAEYFKHGIYSPFFSLQNAVCFIILMYFVPVLFTCLHTEGGGGGHAVAQLVKPSRYKSEGRGFDSLCSRWNFLWT